MVTAKAPPLPPVFLCISLQDPTVIVEAGGTRSARCDSARDVYEFSFPAVKPGHGFIISSLTLEFEYLVGGCPQDGNVSLGIGIGGIVVHSRILVDNPSRSLSRCRSFRISKIFTLGMQGTLRQWMLALPLGATTDVTPKSADCVQWRCCILASL